MDHRSRISEKEEGRPVKSDAADPRDTFSSSARRYLESTDHVSGPDLEVIRQVASSIFPSLTVDVAAGPGNALRAAAPFSGVCVALDLTLEMLRLARDHFAETGLMEVFCMQSSADSLPLINNSVSLLTCRVAPHHFPSIPDFLAEVQRVLRADGRGILIDSLVPGDPECDRFLNEAEHLRDPSHVYTHTRKQWLKFLKEAGLEVLSTTTFDRTHSFREWAQRTGLDDEGIGELERRFLEAPEKIRRCYQVKTDEKEKVLSYTDEKGIFVVKRR
jgi:ubiquinone/menaquinone biosynthesis C-methylase UbiE